MQCFRLITIPILLSLMATPVQAQPASAPQFVALPITELQADEIARFEAAEAGQGAVADENHFYAIVNYTIGQYNKESGKLSGRWQGSRGGPIRHLNSCFVEQTDLYCANSNFPEVPMASSIEVFDTRTMQHKRSYSLGVMEEGSLTWFGRLGSDWIAGFAHYDASGGLGYKDHSFAAVVRFDSEWRRKGGWMLPESVMTRMKPYAASGGALGKDGLLYLSGHDRAEIYVLAAPQMGPKLIHIATVEIDVEGQAFGWDLSADERVIYGISRPNRQVRAFRIPPVAVPSGVRRLTELASQ